MAIADANAQFIAYNLGSPGSQSDRGTVFEKKIAGLEQYAN